MKVRRRRFRNATGNATALGMISDLRLDLRLAAFCAFAAVPFFGAGAARAELMSDWSSPVGTAVRLVAGAPDGKAVTGGVEIRLTPGWKTYWRYPGDSGVPPHFDWSGSQNVENIEVLWPAPVRFDDGGSFSIGYKKDVVIPFRVIPRDAGKPVELRLNLDFAVCEKICQPASASLTLDVPSDGAAPSPPMLVNALATVPRATQIGAAGEPAIASAELREGGNGPSIHIEAHVADAAKADLFVEGPNEDWALPLPSRETGPDGRTVFVLPVDGVPKGADIAATRLRFTLVDGNRAVEVDAPLSAR